MGSSRRSWSFLISGVLVFLIACSPGDSSGNSSTTLDGTTQPGMTSSTSASGTTAAPPSDDVCANSSIRLGTNADPRNINPILAVDLDGRWRTDLMFEPLVRLDGETLQPIPGIATEWEISDDGMEYTFHLRDDILFHDGVPLTAADVEFTILSILSPDYLGPLQAFWSALEGADAVISGTSDSLPGLEVIDEQTIRLTLSQPNAAFMSTVVAALKPVPKHLLEGEPITEESEFSLNPVGSGPYKFVEWSTGNQFSVEANEDYYAGPPCMRAVTQVIIPDQNALAIALETGEIDSTIIAPVGELERLSAVPGLQRIEMPPLRNEGVFFNVADSRLSDVRVREALAMGIDYDEFVTSFLGTITTTSHSFFSPASWAYLEGFDTPPPYDPAAAAALLAEAGYPDGAGLSLEIYTNEGNAAREQVATFIQSELGELGVEVSIRTSDFGTFIADLIAGEYEVAVWAAYTGLPDPAQLADHYHTSGGNNVSQYSNEVVDRLFEEAQLTIDVDERTALYREIQEVLAVDLPFMSGYWDPSSVVLRDDIVGVVPSALGAYWNIQDWYFEAG